MTLRWLFTQMFTPNNAVTTTVFDDVEDDTPTIECAMKLAGRDLVHRAALVVAINLENGATTVVKSRWGITGPVQKVTS